jgi:hypothetical protein
MSLLLKVSFPRWGIETVETGENLTNFDEQLNNSIDFFSGPPSALGKASLPWRLLSE